MNLLLQEHKTLNKLQSRNAVIIITTIDKGIAVIIQDVNQCEKDAEQQLHDTGKYNES